jgi:DNA-binding transcriptional LysR family regulator
MVGTPDWNLLPLFVAVVECGSMSAAARKLGAPKSSVSRGVAALESSLGVQLLHRTTRDVQLTTAGQSFYERARPVLSSYRELTTSIPEQELEPSGTLRITTPVDMGLTFLVDVFANFMARYPKVTLDVSPSNTPRDLVADGFDVALRIATRLSDSSLVARRLGAVELSIFGAPSYLAQHGTPRSLEACEAHRWVLFSGLGKLPDPLSQLSARRVVTDDLLFALGMTRAAVGLSILPAHLAHADVLTGRLVPVVPEWKLDRGSLFFLHPQAQHVPRKVTAFRDYLLTVLAQRPLGEGAR